MLNAVATHTGRAEHGIILIVVRAAQVYIKLIALKRLYFDKGFKDGNVFFRADIVFVRLHGVSHMLLRL